MLKIFDWVQIIFNIGSQNIFELADGLGVILKKRKGKISSNCKLNQCTNCAWRARVSLILRTYSISQCLILKNLISQRMLNKLMVIN